MIKKSFNLRSVVAIAICLAGMTMFSGCSNEDKKDNDLKGNVQYLKTELGGCNRKLESVLRSSDSETLETKDDEFTITVSEESVNVFVGLNYICCAPFETKCETIDDVIIMSIIDVCENPYADCYCRCMCYYTFDFVFTYQGKFNQKYKVLLIDPREEEPIIISEGIITENK